MLRDIECLKNGLESLAAAISTEHFAISEHLDGLGTYELHPTNDDGRIMDWECPRCNKGWTILFRRDL